jgi:hypothetical protein
MNDAFQIDDPSPRQLRGVFVVSWIVKALAAVALLNLLAEQSHGQGNPNTPNIVITAADGSIFVLPPLDPNGDNKPAIQAASDWCESHPGRETVRIPPGTWKGASSFEFLTDVDYQCEMVELTNLNASFVGPIIVAGSSDHPSGGGTRNRADRVTITGLTIRQTADTSANSHCLFVNTGDDWKLTRVKAIGSKHEGLVSGGLTARWIWDRCEAEDCGEGSEHRSASGSGINCNGMAHVLIKCITHRCCQGFEHGGNRTTFIGCEALDGIPGIQGPSVGYNCGNSVCGQHKTRILDCKSTGHPAAITIQNINGRCCGCSVDGFTGENGTINFSGGRPTNIVSTEWDGPDLEPSYVVRSSLKFTHPVGNAILYNPGPSPAYDPQGRTDLFVEDCVVEFVGVPIAQQPASPFAVAGNVVGKVVFSRCGVKGLDSNPVYGDFRTFSNGTNITPSPSGHLKAVDCWATKADGSPRFFTALRERAEQ